MIDDEENVFTGVKYVDELADFVIVKNELATILGLPACPECNRKTLIHDFLRGVWYCPDCHTVWNEHSLVEALQNERAVIELYEEATNGIEEGRSQTNC